MGPRARFRSRRGGRGSYRAPHAVHLFGEGVLDELALALDNGDVRRREHDIPSIGRTAELLAHLAVAL